eukprot:1536015-Prymnesium_polylepis.1
MKKGANAKKLQGCEIRETLVKSSQWVAALRAAAKVEVTKLDPKCLSLLPMSSLSITEASPTLGRLRASFSRAVQE